MTELEVKEEQTQLRGAGTGRTRKAEAHRKHQNLRTLFKNFILFICCSGSQLLRGLLVMVHGLLIVVAYLVAEHRLQAASSVVMAHGLSSSVAHGIFPDQGLNSCLLHWQADPLPLSHQGSPLRTLLRHEFWKTEPLSQKERKLWTP